MANSIAAGFFIVLAIVFFAIGIRNLRALKALSKWPRVDGTVLSVAIDGPEVPSEADNVYRPLIRYEYFHGGRRYRSSRLGLKADSFDFYSRRSAERFLARITAGGNITVLLDPADPGRSVLSPGSSGPRRSHYFALLVSAVIMAAIAAGLFSLLPL